MTQEEFNSLKKGDMVKHKSCPECYVVTTNYGNHITAVDTIDMTRPDEWEIVKKHQPVKEKEVVLKDGQIYLNCTNDWYYVLHQHGCDWKLINIKYPSSYWQGWLSENQMRNEIQRRFTLCPSVTITVKE